MGGSRNSARLLAILEQLPGGPKRVEKALLQVVGPFPVAGLAYWSNDWHAYRCCPSAHLHQGLDIMAPRGTPVVAAADGYISQKVDDPASSGLGLEITGPNGTEYFYAHLDRFASGVGQGQRVAVGDVVGYVGNTGNARGGATHLHFEIQPGGIPVPPMPYVNRWLRIAEKRAEALVERVTGKRVKVELPQIQPWFKMLRDLARQAKSVGPKDLLEDREVVTITNAGAGIYPSFGARDGAPKPFPTVAAAGVASAAVLALAGILLGVATLGGVRRRRKAGVRENPDERGDTAGNAGNAETASGQAGDEEGGSRTTGGNGTRRGLPRGKGRIVSGLLLIAGLLVLFRARGAREKLSALLLRRR